MYLGLKNRYPPFLLWGNALIPCQIKPIQTFDMNEICEGQKRIKIRKSSKFSANSFTTLFFRFFSCTPSILMRLCPQLISSINSPVINSSIYTHSTDTWLACCQSISVASWNPCCSSLFHVKLVHTKLQFIGENRHPRNPPRKFDTYPIFYVRGKFIGLPYFYVHTPIIIL